MGKVHGSLASAGRVRNQTPKIPKKEDKPKPKCGRAKKRFLYNTRFVAVKKGMKLPKPNSPQTRELREKTRQDQKDRILAKKGVAKEAPKAAEAKKEEEKPAAAAAAKPAAAAPKKK